jgi:hypothetical protein
VSIRPFAAEKISESEIDQDQADDAGPDHITGPEHVADQARGREFGGEGRHARDKNCEK